MTVKRFTNKPSLSVTEKCSDGRKSFAHYSDYIFALTYELDTRIGDSDAFKAKRICDMRPVVVKYIAKNQKDEIPDEIQLHLSVSDVTGIINVLDYFRLQDRWAIVTEYHEKDLYDFITENETIQEDTAKLLFKQVINIIESLNSHNVFHGDIKDENFVIDISTMQLKLIDFGSAQKLHNGRYVKFTGTEFYAPPEWLNTKSFYAMPFTVWSLGILLYGMTCGNTPFNTETEIIFQPVCFPAHVNLSAEVKDLIKMCLHKNWKQRCSLDDIKRHQWMAV